MGIVVVVFLIIMIIFLFIHELTIRPPNTDNNEKIKQNKLETKKKQ